MKRSLVIVCLLSGIMAGSSVLGNTGRSALHTSPNGEHLMQRTFVEGSQSLYSPDKQTTLEVQVNAQQQLVYRVSFQQKVVVDWSPMGLVSNGDSIGVNLDIARVEKKQYREKFAWPLGEDEVIRNDRNEMTIFCSSNSRGGRRHFVVSARVYDGSVAFRYNITPPEVDGEGVITRELTAFNLATAAILYQYNQESIFTPTALDTFSVTCDLPATLKNQDAFISIGEAANFDYTKAELVKGAVPNSLAIAYPRDKTVQFESSYVTPWRTISVSKTAVGLHAFSALYLKLAPAVAGNKVPDWIKPGKLIRAQLTTQSGLECIDFAVKHQFQYIMFDAGWYGAEFRSSSDPTQVIEAIDMPKVIAYGKEKGIGVILYVNYVGLRAKLDTILPLYKKWGVAGMKFGFVDGLTQKGLTWLSGAIKKVYDHGFILDIHDNYKPTGLSRTYPQLLTQEGIRGDENSPDAFHNTVLPFTRFLAGPADFTFCFPNPTNNYSKNIKVSKAQQLALTVVYFSPLQAIFWYGRPLEYTNEGEIEFFNHVPTVWNESHYLKGEIGQYISVARRHGNTWFVGNAAGLNAWKDSITLDFLAKGKKYTATVYEDNEQGGITKRTVAVQKGTVLPIDLKATGGQAIMITLVP